MIVLLFIILLVSLLGLLAAWMGQHPGNVTFLWLGYEVQMSVAVLIVAILIITVLASWLSGILKNLLLAPSRYMERRSVKQLQRGLLEITHSVAALAASDIKAAEAHTRKAEKQLGTTPLVLMLKAQVSKSSGNDEASRTLLLALLDHPETEYLAAKSLAEAEHKQQHLPQALQLATRAHQRNPKESGGAWALFELLLESMQWAEAESHIAHSRKKGAFTRSDTARAKGMLSYRMAQYAAQSGSKELALSKAKEAVKYLSGDADVAQLTAQLLWEHSKAQDAAALIRRQWKLKPTEALAALYLQLIEHEKPTRKDRLINALIKQNPTAAENSALRRAP